MLKVVVLPLTLLVVLTFSVFWMDRPSLGDRMDISFIGLLTVVAYQIIREQARQALALTVAPLPRGNIPVYYFLAVVGIFSLLVGTVVYVRRRGVAATAHFYSLCLFWFLMFGFSFTGELGGWGRAFFWMDQAGQLFFPPIFLHFALCFPTKQRIVLRHAWVLWALYLPSVALRWPGLR